MSQTKEVNPPKFIQIATSYEGEYSTNLFALTEDGVVYFYDFQSKTWRRMSTRRNF